VALRGQLMQRMPVGAMLSVALPEAEMEQRIAQRQEELGRVEVSAVNGPGQIVIGGAIETIERWTKYFSSEDVWTRRLLTSHAYHTWLMDEARSEFATAVEKVEKHAPRLNVISCVSGKWLTADEAQSGEYWGRQMRERVRFGAGVNEVLAESGRVVVEAGPGSGLSGLVRTQVQGPAPVLLSLLGPSGRGEANESEAVVRALAKLWLEGVGVKWEELWHGERRRRAKLPTYPFERVRCWIDADPVNKIPEPKNPEYPANPEVSSEEQIMQQQLQVMSSQLELLNQF
jgi:phthiocerol/phenolphthiocerol synthesis type-I polyketide synthase E